MSPLEHGAPPPGDEKVRVVFVLPSLQRAGAETQTVSLVNGLPCSQFQKHLFVFEKGIDQIDRIDHNHVDIHHVPRKWKFDLEPVRRLAKLIDVQGVDIVYCSLQIALLVGWLARLFSKRRPALVVAVHTTINRSHWTELADRLVYQWLMRSCDRIVFVCREQEKFWQAKYPFLRCRSNVVYNGIDTEWFSPRRDQPGASALRANLGIGADAFVVCCIAAFRPEKGHNVLVQSFERVAANVKDAYLLLAGDGVGRSAVQRQVIEHGIQDKVRFLGSVADVRPILESSNLSVIASTAVETFSLAMLESLSMGVPMVATDIGGTKEAVIHECTGLLVPPGDPDAMADAICRMAREPECRQRMAVVARDLVVSQFTRERMFLGAARVIQGLLEAPTTGGKSQSTAERCSRE